MDTNLMLELITQASGLESNLAPLLHENGKLWPYQKSFFVVPERQAFLPGHEQLANATPGIDLRDIGEPIKSSDSNSDQSLSLASVASLLTSSSVSPEEMTFDNALIRGVSCRTYLLAWRIRELSPGSYFYWREGPRLIPVRQLTDEAFEERVALDTSQLKGTAAVIAFCGLVAYDGLHSGERHYRNLLLVAGCAADRIVLSAGSLGVSAGIVAGFLDDALSRELGIDGSYEQPLVAIALKTSSRAIRR